METILTCPVNAEVSVALFGNESIDFTDFEGRKQVFTPDDTRGFFRFDLAHGFPKGATVYGTALHPTVTGNSWPSLYGQNVNYEHRVKAYHPKDSSVDDRILGSVMAVTYPKTPSRGWRISDTSEVVPAISGVASFAKLATAISKMIGEHKGGRHQWTVSMEVRYDYTKSGFMVALNGAKKASSGTPDDVAQAGFEWLPWSESPTDLQSCFSIEKNRMVKKYKNRQAWMMMGGIDGKVNFCGVGIVKYGAEPTAKILQMAASQEQQLCESVGSLGGLLKQALLNARRRR